VEDPNAIWAAEIATAEKRHKLNVALLDLADVTAKLEGEVAYAETLSRIRDNCQKRVEGLKRELGEE